MVTLYRKYRPQTFDEVYGQAHIKKTIQNELKMDKTAHAYLFCGPRGVGKTTMARLLAKAVNCLERVDGTFEPCNTCVSCIEVTEGRSLDVIEIDAASHTGVDHVREHIINAARFVPTNRKFKVFIIDEVHMLSTSAFNALLKILEEPPSYVMFVLATTEIHKILPTIISRCQRFDFKKIKYTQLKERLQKLITAEGKCVDQKVIDMVIAHSDGCLRDAESLLGQVLTLDEQHITTEQAALVLPMTNYNIVADFLVFITANDLHNAIGQLNTMIEQGAHIEQFSKDLIEFLRKILLYKIHGGFDATAADLDDYMKENIEKFASSIELKNIIKMLDIFIKALHELKTAPILQLPLELAVVELLENKIVESIIKPSASAVDVVKVNSAVPIAAPVASTAKPATMMPPTVASVNSDMPNVNVVAQGSSDNVQDNESNNVEIEKQVLTEPKLETTVITSNTQDTNTAPIIESSEVNVEVSEPAISGMAETSNSTSMPTTMGQVVDAQVDTPISDVVDSTPSVDFGFSMGQINASWQKFNELVQTKSMSLSVVMSAGVPQRCEGNKLVVAFKHTFNKEKASDIKYADIINESLLEAYGVAFTMEAIQDTNLEDKYQKKDSISVGEVFQMHREHEVAQNQQPSVENAAAGQAGASMAGGGDSATTSNPSASSPDLNNVLDLFGGSVIDN